MAYRIELKPAAKRQAARLPHEQRAALGQLIKALGSDPRTRGVEAVRGRPGVLRARVGDYRVLFKVNDGQRLVTVGRIALRGRVYQRLRDLHFD